MLAINDLMNQALSNSGISSDRQLAINLGISSAALCRWRTGTFYPKIEHAHRLAVLAGIDPAQVIADILIQSEKRPEVKTTLERFKRALAAAAGVIPVLLIMINQCILCKIEPVRYDRIQSWN